MKKAILGLLLLVLLAGAVACGQPQQVYFGPSEGNAPQAESKSVSSGSGLRVPVPSPTATPTPAPAILVTVPPPVVYDGASAPAERMVIKSAYLVLVVEDVAASMAQIENLAASFGGFVVSSNMGEEQNRLYANISFRVDAKRFNEALRALRDLATDVRSESTSGEDVTEEYIDLGARLRNLEASEAQLLDLMEQAGTVEEILKVQQELVKTREQIEQTKGRMQYLEQSSALSYINASLEQSKLTVEFNATSRTVKEGQGIRFDASVGGGFAPYTYEWDFGDGQTSTDASPVHAYRNDGVYSVTLNIKDDKEHTARAERQDYITVLTAWEAGNTAHSAWNGLVAFGHFLANVFIWLGYFSPLWIVILVILYFTWWRKRKKPQ
jgi:predicted small lipoprotein YifL